MAGPKRIPNPADESRRLWRLAGMGGTLASEIAAGALIGWLLDRWLDTAPILLVSLTLFAVAAGMTAFIRMALKETRAAGRQGEEAAERLSRETDDQSEVGQ